MTELIAPPILGAFIGYSTNWLAIKMIFRPFEPKYIFGYRIPFTPGLIPRNRQEIARKISVVITSHLINPEKLHALFSNDEFKASLNTTVNNIVDKVIDNMMDNLKKQLSEELSVVFLQGIINKLSDKIKEKMKYKLKDTLSKYTENEIDRYLNEDFMDVLKKLDIENLIFQTLMEVNIQTLEDVILGFSKKQLNYITNIGAVIGFFIGVLQVLIVSL